MSPPWLHVVRVFSDVLVAFLYFDFAIASGNGSGNYQIMEKPLKHQRRLGLHRAILLD